MGVNNPSGTTWRLQQAPAEAPSLAAAVDDDFLQWEARLSNVEAGPLTITAGSEDEAGNVEQTPHVLTMDVR